jgi:hypothetical protein
LEFLVAATRSCVAINKNVSGKKKKKNKKKKKEERRKKKEERKKKINLAERGSCSELLFEYTELARTAKAFDISPYALSKPFLSSPPSPLPMPLPPLPPSV